VNLNLGYIDNMSDSPKNSETLDTTPTGASNGYLERVLNDPRFAQAYVDAIRVDPMLGVARLIGEGIRVGAQKVLGKNG